MYFQFPAYNLIFVDTILCAPNSVHFQCNYVHLQFCDYNRFVHYQFSLLPILLLPVLCLSLRIYLYHNQLATCCVCVHVCGCACVCVLVCVYKCEAWIIPPKGFVNVFIACNMQAYTYSEFLNSPITSLLEVA